MIVITKKRHFYAAHRNELIDDKCKNLHGHTYYVTAHIKMGEPNETGVTMLFSDIDKSLDMVIDALDHSLLIHIKDPLFVFLEKYKEETGELLKINDFNFPTSAEHLAKFILEDICYRGLNCIQIDLQETTTSTVTYTKPDTIFI